MKHSCKKNSNSNPLKSLFEVEHFLNKITNMKSILSIVKNSKKLKTNSR